MSLSYPFDCRQSHASLTPAPPPLPVSPIDGDRTVTKMGDFATNGEIYRFAMQSYRNVEQAIYGHVYEGKSPRDEATSADQNESMDVTERTFQTAKLEGRRYNSDAVRAEDHENLWSEIRDVIQ